MSSSHDEYSSDEEDLFDENEKTDVYLGFVDDVIESDEDDEESQPTIEDTFIGSKPIWLHPDSQPDPASLTCDNCDKKMALLMQAFAPIDGKLYDRVIYIFACKNTGQCSKKKGSVKCIRGINKDPKKIAQIKAEQEEEVRKQLDEKLKIDNQKKLNIELTKDLFNNSNSGSGNPFGSNPFGSSSSNPFENKSSPFTAPAKSNDEESKKEDKKTNDKKTYAQASALKADNKVSKIKSKDPITLPSYQGYFIYVDQEKFKKVTLEPELEKYKHLVEEMEMDEGSSSDKKGRSSSVSSSSSATLNPQAKKISNMLDDKYFENFTNVVKHNPSQILRYDLGGKPLLYNGKDEVAKKFIIEEGKDFNVPNPGYNPSSKRQFELQLMPQTIMNLEQLEDSNNIAINDILNGMSWGTIIVCTDIEDYIPEENFDENHVGYIEDWCGVQWEESV
ncbi:hypothetical protein HYPBUDRAFT_104684 [Hyphopichia burtonii NRRL Y-1933]|uniref:Programmed cell death protein 2 C-terminal domain-containing protein n=1 Tax=Hyphopichia burtonii NRRL Y-1933 TaxID=984485 RepID=A0A1E4RNP5_9ASCO|nr:hypothetical protein HYPBUDRAFT_104684 [Hyphopichia burtonii NRRL Y-1933]ODV68856.1 hypothetical protein HYPBUDRAFT_104684 [Hyphopichia burtonii NRRL Y-1933]